MNGRIKKRRRKMEWLTAAPIAVACWVLASPWVLGSGTSRTAVVNHAVIACAIVAATVYPLARPSNATETSRVRMLLGGWLVLSQFVLDYSDIPDRSRLAWGDVVAGVAVMLLAGWSGFVAAGGARRH